MPVIALFRAGRREAAAATASAAAAATAGIPQMPIDVLARISALYLRN